MSRFWAFTDSKAKTLLASGWRGPSNKRSLYCSFLLFTEWYPTEIAGYFPPDSQKYRIRIDEIASGRVNCARGAELREGK
jgi:hypothetical protein